MEDKIIDLQKKVAFMEHKLEELNEVVVDQAQVIEELKNRLKDLGDQLQSGPPVRKLEDEDLPPHY